MKRVAIITARGGSKRLPRKNIRPFHGRPMIHYPIAAARACRLFDVVYVSTEDEEISDLAMAVGAGFIPRPPELADDHATTGQAMRHAVEYLTERGAALEHVACIYPCTPMMLPGDLIAGFERLVASKKSYCFAVARYEPPIARAMAMWPDGAMREIWPQFNQVRTQDLEARFYGAGQWYWGTAAAWLNEVPIHSEDSIGHEIPRLRAIDIDTYEDWRLAEAVFSTFGSRCRSPSGLCDQTTCMDACAWEGATR